MTIPASHERALLSQASSALEEAVERSGLEASVDVRLRLLEGAAAHVGGYGLDRFDRAVAGGGGARLVGG